MSQQGHDIGLPLEAETGYTHQREHIFQHRRDNEQPEPSFVPPIAEIVFTEPLLGSKEPELSNDSKSSKGSKKYDDDSPLSSALSTASSALHIMRRESSADNFTLIAAASAQTQTASPAAAVQPTASTISQSQEGGSSTKQGRRKGFPSRRDRANANRNVSYGSLSSFNNARAATTATASDPWRRPHPQPSSHPMIDSGMVYDTDYQRSLSMLRSHPHTSQLPGGGISSSLPSRSSPRKAGRKMGLALRQNNVHSSASQQHPQHSPPNSKPSHSAQHFYHSSSAHESAPRSLPSPTRDTNGHSETNSPPSPYHHSTNSEQGASSLHQHVSRVQLYQNHQPNVVVTTEPSTTTNTDSNSASARSSQTPPSSQTPVIENISVKSGLTASSTSSLGRRRQFSNPDAVACNEETQLHVYPRKEESIISTGDGANESVLVPSRKIRNALVSFGTVEIRRYTRILGDNPSCSAGPALSLDWNHDDRLTTSASVDDFEYYRGERRADNEMVLTRVEREEMLVGLGYSKREIADAIRKNVNIKNRRRQTVNNLKVMPFEQAIQGAARKISRVVLRKSSSKTLYKNWLEQEQLNVARSPTAAIVCQEESSSSMESESLENPIQSSFKGSDVSFASSSVGFRSRDSTKGARTSTTMTTTTHSAEHSMTMTATGTMSTSNPDVEQELIYPRKESVPQQPSCTDVSTRLSEATLSGWTTDNVPTTEYEEDFESGLRLRCEGSHPKLSHMSQSGCNISSNICNEIMILEQDDSFLGQ